jgi:hypothetical protein
MEQVKKRKSIPAKTFKQYYKRFANGEQYISINPITGKIEKEDRIYWWQQQGVYNYILPIIKSQGKDLTEDDLYGKAGLVALLEPYQRAYNKIMNLHNEHIEFSTYGFMAVEDGSVDVEALEADGLGPGKIVVYRQGSIAPSVTKDELNIQQYLESAEYYCDKMLAAAETFCNIIKKTGF